MLDSEEKISEKQAKFTKNMREISKMKIKIVVAEEKIMEARSVENTRPCSPRGDTLTSRFSAVFSWIFRQNLCFKSEFLLKFMKQKNRNIHLSIIFKNVSENQF